MSLSIDEPSSEEATTIALPDPCPHVTNVELIRAKLHAGPELERILSHLHNCK